MHIPTSISFDWGILPPHQPCSVPPSCGTLLVYFPIPSLLPIKNTSTPHPQIPLYIDSPGQKKQLSADVTTLSSFTSYPSSSQFHHTHIQLWGAWLNVSPELCCKYYIPVGPCTLLMPSVGKKSTRQTCSHRSFFIRNQKHPHCSLVDNEQARKIVSWIAR